MRVNLENAVLDLDGSAVSIDEDAPAPAATSNIRSWDARIHGDNDDSGSCRGTSVAGGGGELTWKDRLVKSNVKSEFSPQTREDGRQSAYLPSSGSAEKNRQTEEGKECGGKETMMTIEARGSDHLSKEAVLFLLGTGVKNGKRTKIAGEKQALSGWAGVVANGWDGSKSSGASEKQVTPRGTTLVLNSTSQRPEKASGADDGCGDCLSGGGDGYTENADGVNACSSNVDAPVLSPFLAALAAGY